MKIDGNTAVIGIFADPISHVQTPQALNPLLAQLGKNAVVVPMHITSQDLPSAWQGLKQVKSFQGAVVTAPHKSAILALVDDATDAARQAGAANVVRRAADGRMIAGIFDGIGFVQGLIEQGRDPAGRKVLLVGAGGCGKAIAFALCEAGVAHLTISNRTEAAAASLVAAVKIVYPHINIVSGLPEVAGKDIAVNATSLGLRPDDPLPFDPTTGGSEVIIADVVMFPETTPLLHAAEAHGCPAHRGKYMLQQQLQLIAKFLDLPDGILIEKA